MCGFISPKGNEKNGSVFAEEERRKMGLFSPRGKLFGACFCDIFDNFMLIFFCGFPF